MRLLPILISKLEKIKGSDALNYTKRIEKFLSNSKYAYTPAELSKKLKIKRRTTVAVLRKLLKKGIVNRKEVKNKVFYYYKRKK